MTMNARDIDWSLWLFLRFRVFDAPATAFLFLFPLVLPLEVQCNAANDERNKHEERGQSERDWIAVGQVFEVGAKDVASHGLFSIWVCSYVAVRCRRGPEISVAIAN